MAALPSVGSLRGLVSLLGLLLVESAARGTLPVDYATYQASAEAIALSKSPYGTPEQSHAAWKDIHQFASQLDGQRTEKAEAPQPSGPYLYPPTLALLVYQAGLNTGIFTLLVLISIVGFGKLWLDGVADDGSKPSAWWLLLIVGSWDVAASFSGLNVELVLLFLALLSARLLWLGHGLMAAFPCALMILIKPFYALFVAAFGLILIFRGRDRRTPFRCLAVAATGTLSLIVLEVLRWPDWLRAEAVAYLQSALAHQWLVLPLEEQAPMSIWNRTPLQVLVNFGMEAGTAQQIALLLWGGLLLASLWWIRWRALSFALAFGLAYALFLWGRPVNWTLPYLDIILLLAVWSRTRAGWQRRALGIGAAALALSHWVALFRTVGGIDANLFTLQTAAFPWETLSVLPLSWLLLILAARQQPRESLGQTW